MTRIGKVKVKLGDKLCAPTVLQYVTEDGEGWTLATFRYHGLIFNWKQGLIPGGMVHATHAEYRRVA